MTKGCRGNGFSRLLCVTCRAVLDIADPVLAITEEMIKDVSVVTTYDYAILSHLHPSVWLDGRQRTPEHCNKNSTV